MIRFRPLIIGAIFLTCCSINAIAQSTAVIGTITTYAGKGDGQAQFGPSCNRFNPCNQGNGFSGDGGAAISALLFDPYGVVVDRAGSLLIADTNNNRIRKVTPDGIISTIIGGQSGFSGDGGSAINAQLANPQDLAMDAAGNLFIADYGNRRIRKVSVSGTISTIAGNGTAGDSGDGSPAISAEIRNPLGVAVDAGGDVFIADAGSDRIRKVTPDGLISTVAGNGIRGFSGDGGPATLAMLNTPSGVAVDAAGNLFIADQNNNRIRKVTPNGVISTIAGNGTSSFGGDHGPAFSAGINQPWSITVDTVGNLFIAESYDNRIRKVTPAGVISTIAGNGTAGVSGDGGPATSAALYIPSDVAPDAAGNLFIADTFNHRIRKVTAADVEAVSFANAISLTSTGSSPNLATGYAVISSGVSSVAPSGLAIFGFHENGMLISEATVPASRLLQSGRIYAEVSGPVNTGIALANPNDQAADVSFFFTDSSGNNVGNTVATIPAKSKISGFLNQPPFNGSSAFVGSFTFSSSVPIAAVALRGFFNERSETLMTTLPVVDLGSAPASGPLIFAQFANGGGWTTQIALVNPGDVAISGTIQFVNPQGLLSNLVFSYSIPSRTSQTLKTAGMGNSISVGSIHLTPDAGSPVPSGFAIFSFLNNGVTVTEAGVPASTTGTEFRLYAESAGSIETGLAVANVSSTEATVTLELDNLDGSFAGFTGNVSIPANGQVASFLNQIPGFTSLPATFQGVLRLSSTTSISVVGLRGRYNQRGDFLIATTPPADETASPSAAPIFFPHIVDSGGYTTQFILFSAGPAQSPSGVITLFSSSGGPMNIALQ